MDGNNYQAFLAERNLDPVKPTHMELLAVAGAREISDGAFVFVGTGLPLLAAGLAKRTTAPNMVMILEAGTVDPIIEHMPVFVADPRAAYHAGTLSTVADAFGSVACRGYCTIGMLGGAECDMYGNLNSTSIGGYWPAGVSEDGCGPKVRLAGSGGATNIASLADRIIVIMVHEKRRLPPKVSFLSSCCGRRGPGNESRQKMGMFRGGDVCVISDLGIMRTDQETGILYLSNYYSGIDPEWIKQNTGWNLDISRAVELQAPTSRELEILRLEVDPHRLYLGRKSRREQ